MKHTYFWWTSTEAPLTEAQVKNGEYPTKKIILEHNCNGETEYVVIQPMENNVLHLEECLNDDIDEYIRSLGLTPKYL